MPSPIDLTCSCLEKLDLYDWINLASNQLEVYSEDNNINGVYQIVVVYEVEQLENVQSYTTFKLQVKELITSIDLTPKTKLVVVNVIIG